MNAMYAGFAPNSVTDQLEYLEEQISDVLGIEKESNAVYTMFTHGVASYLVDIATPRDRAHPFFFDFIELIRMRGALVYETFVSHLVSDVGRMTVPNDDYNSLARMRGCPFPSLVEASLTYFNQLQNSWLKQVGGIHTDYVTFKPTDTILSAHDLMTGRCKVALVHAFNVLIKLLPSHAVLFSFEEFCDAYVLNNRMPCLNFTALMSQNNRKYIDLVELTEKLAKSLNVESDDVLNLDDTIHAFVSSIQSAEKIKGRKSYLNKFRNNEDVENLVFRLFGSIDTKEVFEETKLYDFCMARLSMLESKFQISSNASSVMSVLYADIIKEIQNNYVD